MNEATAARRISPPAPSALLACVTLLAGCADPSDGDIMKAFKARYEKEGR